MMSARYRFQHLASLVFRHGPDVGLMSFPMSSLSDIGLMSARYRFRHQTSVVFRHRPDVGLISLTTSGRHRAHVQTWSRPDISRHLPISARYILPTSGCCRGRHLPISGRHRASMVFRNRPTSSLYRPDVGLISLTTSGRYRPDIFCQHQAAVVADIEPLWFSDIGLTSSLYRPDVGQMSA